MIKAIMVDVDGVLVAGRPSDGLPWSTSLEADLGFSPEDLHREFFIPYWHEIVIGKSELKEKLDLVLPKIAAHLSSDRLIDYWFANDAGLNLPLLNVLDRFRAQGIKIYLATNQEHLRAAFLLERLGLSKHVDGCYYSAALGFKKPDWGFFEWAATHSGFSVEELLLLDDTQANITAAKQLGWQVIEWQENTSGLKALIERVQTS